MPKGVDARLCVVELLRLKALGDGGVGWAALASSTTNARFELKKLVFDLPGQA